MWNLQRIFRGPVCRLGTIAGLCLWPAAVSQAEPPSPEQQTAAQQAEVFFEKEVRPLLAERCHKCHGPQKKSGDLRLDSRQAILAGGGSGPAVVPGKPEESLLVEAIRYESLEMPPKDRLNDRQVDVLVRWVKLGAPWPNDRSPTVTAGTAPGTDDATKWWAFQPLHAVAPPDTGNDRPVNEIDRFILARLKTAELGPAPEASRPALARRVYFDLVGLPPTPEEMDAFTADESPGAYERLVDRLLESSHFGERLARHWLDLVRYADSDGYRADEYRPHAWRYRDYVVAAFNADKPYDRFVQEQLAGDELFPDDPDALTATGYLRHWIYEWNNRDVRGQWSVILNDITDTTGDVFLGLGIQCARCHDHKFDPILQKDYFRLQAFFAALEPRDDLVAATAAQQAEHAVAMSAWEAKTAALRHELEQLEAPYRKRAEEEAITRFPDDTQAMLRKARAERAPLEHQLAELAHRQVINEWDHIDRRVKGDDKEKLLALRKQLAAFDKEKPAPLPAILAATDLGPQAAPVLIPKKSKQPIEPGFPSLFGAEPALIETVPNAAQTTGRRATLARWLTRADNPLTARVIVNRVWQYHFGRGLAANASDFGKLGEPPTHPELLDWLATQFVSDGWSLKKLHRRIVTSATYRQSVQHPALAAGQQKDPENRLYWRGNTRRLDAEQIRDALYAVTGELDLHSGGPGETGKAPRRSIYMRVMRNTREPLLDVFDAPYWFSSASSRDTTTTPVQSLLLINSQLMLQRAKAFADRLEREEPSDARRRIERAYALAFGRLPTAAEQASAEQFLLSQSKRIQPETAGSAQAAFLYGKIPYRDGQAATCDPDGPQRSFQITHSDQLPKGDFTIEAFVLPRSVYETPEVRCVASKWSGNTRQPGWLFGITGKGSRRKPQTLVLQFFGQKLSGSFGEDAVFSDQHIERDKPYYVAASAQLAAKEPGSVTFYVKDLSNDDEPLLMAKVPLTITGGYDNRQPLAIGSRSTGRGSFFDGLIDDVRLSDTALAADQILFATERTNDHTAGYWRFEPKPGVFGDSSGHALDIQPGGTAENRQVDAQQAALVDFCHVLLNASEFLYVE